MRLFFLQHLVKHPISLSFAFHMLHVNSTGKNGLAPATQAFVHGPSDQPVGKHGLCNVYYRRWILEVEITNLPSDAGYMKLLIASK